MKKFTWRRITVIFNTHIEVGEVILPSTKDTCHAVPSVQAATMAPLSSDIKNCGCCGQATYSISAVLTVCSEMRATVEFEKATRKHLQKKGIV